MSSDSQESPDSQRPLAEITHGPSAFEQFLERNQKSLLIVGILGVIGIAATVVYRGIEDGKQTAAGEAFNRADDLASLQGVVKNHPGTAAAGSAMVLLATRQWTEGQREDAVETLRTFLKDYPEHPARHSARASLGAKLMTLGKAADANEVLTQLSDDPKGRFLAPYGIITRGDIAKAAGDTQLAESLYQQARDEFPESNFADAAARRINLIKSTPPTEIDPPPAPAPDPAAPAIPGTDTSGDVPAVTNPFIVEPSPTPPAEDSAPVEETTPAETAPAVEAPAPAEEAPAPQESAPAEATPPAQPPANDP